MRSGNSITLTYMKRTEPLASFAQNKPLSDGPTVQVKLALRMNSNGQPYPEVVEPDAPVATRPGDAADPDNAVVEQAKV